jgi:hypothetical protein
MRLAWSRIALVEFWFRPVPWPVMIRVVSAGLTSRGDFAGAAQDEAGHRRVDAHRQAVMQGFSAHHRGRTAQFEFAGNYILGEIALADEIRDDVNLVGIDHVERLTHRGFLFPETTMHFGKQSAAADFIGVIEIGCGRIRVFSGSVTDDEQGAVWFWRERHGRKVPSFRGNARPRGWEKSRGWFPAREHGSGR